ncbi:MAG: hypothetical protein ACI835_005330 [Planctomycetota bacterium]|jgi:hypothetical protein
MISSYGNERDFSPRELAIVVGESEPSVKRWLDAGRIPAS